MKKQLYSFIFTGLMRWKIEGEFDESVQKCVFIIVPHTSWFDFIIGLLVRGIMDVDIRYVAKKELFQLPFGWYFRWMGGNPIDRTGGRGKVDAIAAIFERRQQFRLAIAPEGTRKKVSALKTGFYYIALQANVPIISVAFDYPTRTVKISPPLYPNGDISQDMAVIESFFDGVTGKFSKYSFRPARRM